MNIDQAIDILSEKVKQSPEPMTREIAFLHGRDPYLILISCLLSLQTRDTVTLPVSIELFKKVKTPTELLALPLKDLERVIKSINYYKTKAQRLRSVSQELLDRFDGNVPDTVQDLRSIKGVGLKTANLVLAEAFNIPAICVDTHVHRLSNHWGLVTTRTPDQTEVELCKILPKKYWIDWNYLLVKWGQNFCKRDTVDCSLCVDIIELLRS